MKKTVFAILLLAALAAFITYSPKDTENQRENPENFVVEDSRIKDLDRENLETVEGRIEELRAETVYETPFSSAEREVVNGDTLRMNYIGWRASDGFVFDESFNYSDSGYEFIVGGNVIKGWSEGVIGMKVGEVRKLYIPAEKGYGDDSPSEDIPADTDLIFEVELLEFVD